MHYLATLPDSDIKMKHLLAPKLSYFTWFKIWRIPTIRLVANMINCDENWELNEEANFAAFKQIVNSKNPEWVVLFPEVNTFSNEAFELQQEMSQKYYLPKLTNILYPRFSGFYNAIQALDKTSFSRLYDISIIYVREQEKGHTADRSSEAPSAFLPRKQRKDLKHLQQDLNIQTASPLLSETSSVITGRQRAPRTNQNFSQRTVDFKAPKLLEILAKSPSPYTIKVHIKSKLLTRVPTKRRHLEKWLESHWCEKDRLITQLKNEVVR